jgi:Major Facilitator Superfamily
MAGGLVEAIGAAASVALDAVSFLGSALAVAAIRTAEARPEVPEKGRRRFRHDIAEGLQFVFSHTLLRAIAATTATSNLFSGIAAAVEVVFLVRTVHASAGEIGLVFALGGLGGGVLGAFVAGAVAQRVGGARATLLGIACNAGALLMPLTMPGPGLLLFGAGMLIVGFAAVVYNVNQVSFRQRLCPDRLLGRMNATMRFVVWGVLPVGALIGGLLGSVIGLRPTLWVGVAGRCWPGCGWWPRRCARCGTSPTRPWRDSGPVVGPPALPKEPGVSDHGLGTRERRMRWH